MCQEVPFFLSLCQQIECSSISEYSEKIIKSNHLHNGKLKCFFLSHNYYISYIHLSDVALRDDIWIRRSVKNQHISIIAVTPRRY